MGSPTEFSPAALAAQPDPSGDARRARSSRSHAWVPIRSLGPRQRQRILLHLRSLEPRDRYMRFGYAAGDQQLERYVASLDFERDELFGIFNRRLELIGMAHLAYAPAGPDTDKPPVAEFGVSVLARWRGRGFGARLFEHAVLHARNRGIDTLLIHALAQNAPMLNLVRHAGATVLHDGPDAEARLKLPPEDWVSHLGEMVGQQAAEWDYRLKVQAHLVDDFLSGLGEVKRPTRPLGTTGSD